MEHPAWLCLEGNRKVLAKSSNSSNSGVLISPRWLALVLLLHVCGHSSKPALSIEVIPVLLPLDKGCVQWFFMTLHNPCRGRTGLIYPYQFHQLRKQMHPRSCGTLVTVQALHGRGSQGDSWARHKQIRVADCLGSSTYTETFNKYVWITTVK